MELNPYQPPIVALPTLADEASAGDRPAPRPIGIWILSGVHLLVGVLVFTMLLILLWQLSTGRTIRLVVPMGVAIVLVGVIAGLAASTSIGMWLGAKWGWWLTAFYYVWAMLGVVADSALVLWWLDEVDPEALASIVTKKAIQFTVHGLILLYLLKGTVRAFFRLKSLRMVTALVILAAIAIVVLAATYAAVNSQVADGP